VKKVSDLNDLEKRIDELEAIREVQKKELHENFRAVAHELSPVNLLRKGVKEIVTTPGLKATAVDTAIGSGAGYIGKKLFIGRSGNIFRKLGGMAFQFIIENLIRNKIPRLRANKGTKITTR
jgi:hypothetical protein